MFYGLNCLKSFVLKINVMSNNDKLYFKNNSCLKYFFYSVIKFINSSNYKILEILKLVLEQNV